MRKGISILMLLAGMASVLYMGIHEDAKLVVQAESVEAGTEAENETEVTLGEINEDDEKATDPDDATVKGKDEKNEEKSATVYKSVAASEQETKEAEQAVEEEENETSDEVLFDDWDAVEVFETSKMLFSQSNVNVRKGPDTIYDIVGTLATNDQVEAIGSYHKDNEWIEIKYHGDEAFVSGKYLGENQIDLEALRAQQEAAAMAAIEADLQRQQAEAAAAAQAQQEQSQPPAPAQAPVSEPAPAPYIASPAGVVFVGDSRCVQMQAAVGGGGSTWICEGGKRVSWMESNAVPRLDNIVGKGTKVVICMGVNDPWHYPEYAALTNQKAAEWNARGATVYFVSVNPVWENPYVTQEQVDTFNANMPGLLSGVRWIDTASIVKQGGYKLVDGLHYDTSAYINIFNLICGSL